jgi:DNA-binding PadR family transcriptional regulator
MNDLIILATLLPGPKHGYQLKREAGFIFGDTALHNNFIYPLLRRFTSQGWVTKKPVAGERGQTRQQYALTSLGRKTLIARLGEFTPEDSTSFSAFIARVGMFEILGAATREQILKQREAYLRRRQQQFTILEANMELGRYAAQVIFYLRNQLQSELSWIRRLRRVKK